MSCFNDGWTVLDTGSISVFLILIISIMLTKYLCRKSQQRQAAGFFYTGCGDFIRCYYCGLVLQSSGSWVNVNTEHHRHSPACWFIQQHLMPNVRFYFYSENVVISQGPVHREYKCYVRRLLSFLGTFQIHPVNELAFAGFFYDATAADVEESGGSVAVTNQPKYREHVLFQRRLDSFRYWIHQRVPYPYYIDHANKIPV